MKPKRNFLLEMRAAYMEMLKKQFIKFFLKKLKLGTAPPAEILDDWVSDKAAMSLLACGRTKLQQLKNEDRIAFTQHKKTLLFSRNSIQQFLKKHSSLY